MIAEVYLDVLSVLLYVGFIAWRWKATKGQYKLTIAFGAIVFGALTGFIMFTYHLTVPLQARALNCTVSYFSVSCPTAAQVLAHEQNVINQKTNSWLWTNSIGTTTTTNTYSNTVMPPPGNYSTLSYPYR